MKSDRKRRRRRRGSDLGSAAPADAALAGDWVEEPRVLLSPLTPEECRARLAARTESMGYWLKLPPPWDPLPPTGAVHLAKYILLSGARRRTPLRGWVTGEEFAVRKYVLNPGHYQPAASGRFEPHPDGGTRITVDLFVAPTVRPPIRGLKALPRLMWVAIAAVLALGVLVPGSVELDSSTMTTLFSVALLVSIVVGLYPEPGQWAGEDEFLLRVLKETLQAEEPGSRTRAGSRRDR